MEGDERDRPGEQDESGDGGDHRAQRSLVVADPTEEQRHGERGKQLEHHQADHAGGVHPEQELLVRVGSRGREGEDDGRAEGGLQDAGEVRGAVAGVDAAEGLGQDALLGEGETVAVDRVVEGEE